MRATISTSSAAIVANSKASSGSSADYDSQAFLVKRAPGAGVSVFVESNAAATLVGGFEWEPTDPPLQVELEPGEALYGITSSGSQVLHILRLGT